MFPAFRRMLALAISPDLRRPAPAQPIEDRPARARAAGGRTQFTDDLIFLSRALGEHEDITHWGVSMRLTGKGDQIDRLIKGGDVRTGTYEVLMERFSEIWPADLAWPKGIARPQPGRDVA